MSSSIPCNLDELSPGTFLFINEDSQWKLFLILRKNNETELKELNISHIEKLDIELANLPKDKIPEDYLENDIKNIVRLIPLHPIDSYDDISGKEDFFQCLTSAQVTRMVNHYPQRIKVAWYDYPEGIPFFGSLREAWVNRVEADILLGKLNRNEIENINDKSKKDKILPVNKGLLKQKRSPKIVSDPSSTFFNS